MFGWIAAAIAVAAGIGLAVDIAHQPGSRQVDVAVTHTLTAAKAAGADVLPTAANASKPIVSSR